MYETAYLVQFMYIKSFMKHIHLDKINCILCFKPYVLHGCETWSLALREERTVRGV
jgi:hypothetical protein